jgi:hypothetical protein
MRASLLLHVVGVMQLPFNFSINHDDESSRLFVGEVQLHVSDEIPKIFPPLIDTELSTICQRRGEVESRANSVPAIEARE